MAVTINVNKLTLSHKGSGGVSTATIPDVCKTPCGPSIVPIPYPNISFSNTLSKGTKTVKVDGGNMASIKGSEYSMSIGDEPGVCGGVKSGTFKKESTWITYSFDVKMDGKNACRLTDKKFQNHQNTVDMAGDLEMVVVGPPEPEPEQTCDNNTLNKLKTEKESICGSIPQGSCSPSKVSKKRLAKKPCSEIRARIEAIQNCLAVRQKITDECFGGRTDARHREQERQLNSGMSACRKLESVNCSPGHAMADK